MKKSLKLLVIAIAAMMSMYVTATEDTGLQLKLSDKLESRVNIDQEIECLAQGIYYEAGSESHEGKLAVAQVVINRSEDKRYPNTICGVISQKTVVSKKTFCQFSWYCNAKRNTVRSSEKYLESLEIARLVIFEGVRLSKVKDALYFHATHVKPNWGKFVLARIGNHIFYGDRPYSAG